MSEAPERIWLDNLRTSGGETFGICGVRAHVNGGQEYIRADLVHAAVKRAIEACADKCADRAAYIEDCIKWGGTKTYLTSLKGGIIELSNTGSAIRAIASDPEAIAKIVSGK